MPIRRSPVRLHQAAKLAEEIHCAHDPGRTRRGTGTPRGQCCALWWPKLEKDRQALEAEITASAAASKAAAAITKALQSDAMKKVKNLEAECAQWE